MNKAEKYSLVEGGIVNKLFFVALPIMGTQIIQMAYNLTDMFWLGRLSSDAVAASGTVGLFLWLSMAFTMFGRMGAEIGVSQNFGRGDKEKALAFARNAMVIGVAVGAVLAVIFILCRGLFIGFFGIKEAHVAQDAKDYLAIVSMGFPFVFFTAAVTGIFNGSGNSRVSLIINGVGLIINMSLDPLMIFTLDMGIKGAAYATALAQVSTSFVAGIALIKFKSRPFERVRMSLQLDKAIVKQILKWVLPIFTESFLFTFLTMITSSFVASYSSVAMAASRVGSQIESLAWLITVGFASALTAFVGQNFGAGKWSRIRSGFKISSLMMAMWGIITGLIFFFFGRTLFSIFIPNDPNVVNIGAEYLRILALCQIPGCLEGVASGSFKGRGKTLPPSIASASSNTTRVILAYILSNFTPLGLTGIWIAITISAALRGSWIFIWYLIDSRKTPKTDVIDLAAQSSAHV